MIKTHVCTVKYIACCFSIFSTKLHFIYFVNEDFSAVIQWFTWYLVNCLNSLLYITTISKRKSQSIKLLFKADYPSRLCISVFKRTCETVWPIYEAVNQACTYMSWKSRSITIAWPWYPITVIPHNRVQ